MRTEIEALKRKNTWAETSLNEATKANKTPVTTIWVYKYEFEEQGWLTRFKARPVARGDFSLETFAATSAARLF